MRRLAGAGGLILATVVVVLGGSACAGGRQPQSGQSVVTAGRPARLIELPGGRQIFPAHRVVAYYGAPGDPRLRILGLVPLARSPASSSSRRAAYRAAGRPVLPAV